MKEEDGRAGANCGKVYKHAGNWWTRVSCRPSLALSRVATLPLPRAPLHALVLLPGGWRSGGYSVSLSSQLPSAQNNPYAKVACFEVACFAALHLQRFYSDLDWSHFGPSICPPFLLFFFTLIC